MRLAVRAAGSGAHSYPFGDGCENCNAELKRSVVFWYRFALSELKTRRRTTA